MSFNAGDFNTNKDQIDFSSEKTFKIFKENGFSSGFENIPLSERVTLPSKGRYPDATFDYIFVKGLGEKFIKPTIMNSHISDHMPVNLTLDEL